MTKNITITLNGKEESLIVDIKSSLLDVLRNQLYMTSVKQGCSVGECGACAVLVDDVAVDSCIYLAMWADGKSVRTAEGLSKGGQLNIMQRAFIETGAVQCGFCTPGLLMTATEMKESGVDFSRAEIKRELSGHLCRCTGYQKIVDAVEQGLK